MTTRCLRHALTGALSLALLSACLGDVDVPPSAPTLLPIPVQTSVPQQVLSGTRQRWTAVLNHGEEIAPPGEEESWSATVALQRGDNLISLTAKTRRGTASNESTEASINYDPPCPDPPTLSASPPGVTSSTTHALDGTKGVGTTVELRRLDVSGAVAATVAIPAAADTESWSHGLTGTDFPDGDALYRFEIVAVDDKARTSEPVTFDITLDTTAPDILLTTRYPPDGAIDVPNDVVVTVVLNGPMPFDPDLPPSVMTVHNGGTPVGGTLRYEPLTHSLSYTISAVAGTPSFDVTVLGTATAFADAAGNTGTADRSWSFTLLGTPDATVPAVPTLDATPPETTGLSELPLSGGKPTNTAVLVNGLELVPIDASPTWSAEVPLQPGANSLDLTTRSGSGVESAALTESVERQRSKPLPPVIDADTPTTVSQAFAVISGTKEAGTAILLNGQVAVCRTAETTWAAAVQLVPGINDLSVRATTNEEGTDPSDPVIISINFEQEYDGLVAGNFRLLIAFELRNLVGRLPIAGTFDGTGVNKYSVDAWLEGPLQPGETCTFNASTHERQSPRLAATIMRYEGSKSGHVNPFEEPDYHAPNFLAALISSGALAAAGLSPTIDRRAADGRPHATVASTLAGSWSTVSDAIRSTCGRVQPLPTVDACTAATIEAAAHQIEWFPKLPDVSRLPQGDYLLNLTFNLDRDPGWVGTYDRETCWSDAAFSNEGPHRIVRRVALGDATYTLPIGNLAEEAGTDPDNADGQLRYITDRGITISWGPQ